MFLAGDAAHVHPIAGGLGMNSGIQDAYNLGWKLGLVLVGHATSGLLATYEEERLPIASWLLDITSERLNAVLNAIKNTGGGVDAAATPELTQIIFGYPWSRLSRHTVGRFTGPLEVLRLAHGHRSERPGPGHYLRPRSSSACRASANGLSSQARWSASP